MMFSSRLVSMLGGSCVALLALGCASSQKAPLGADKEAGLQGQTETLKQRVAKFAPTEIGLDEVKIPAAHRPVIKKLVQAGQLMDRLFFLQVAKQNPAWREQIAADPANTDLLAYFDIMYGPWDRLDDDKPFWGQTPKPMGATFYPVDASQSEIEKWIAKHPEQKGAFTGYFTVIERDGNALKAVPYSEAYKEYLEPAAKLLDEAAALAKDKRLAKYLGSRAQAFRDNEYRQSDMDWMDLGDGDIEVVIGPYEVYEDKLMGFKAAFEAFVTLRDPEASKALLTIESHIPQMEQYLPIPAEYKSSSRGLESPISVVDVLFTAGDTRSGVQTIAFNLPNDEFVREKKGSKKVMLKNVCRAKYDKILVPIAERLVRADQVGKVSFEAFFNHTLVHETAHGLGPGKLLVTRDGKKIESSVNLELKELYSTIEEAKADVLGLYLNFFLIDKGVHPVSFKENIYASFLGGFFRSVRFGTSEAHGKANAIQFNYLLEKGAIVKDADGRYGYDAAKMPAAVKELAHDVLMIEARGDYAGANVFIDKYGKVPAELSTALSKLTEVPTDIRPFFPIEKKVESW